MTDATPAAVQHDAGQGPDFLTRCPLAIPKPTLKRTPRKTSRTEVRKEFSDIAVDDDAAAAAAETADEKRAEAVRLREDESALKEQEQELARLRKESETFPARLAKETEASAARATKEAEAKFEQQILLGRKDAEAERRVAELRIQSLDQVIASQAAQIALLEKQLAEAKTQVQEIAVKAIEGASGARALARVNQIAIEQAKNRPQS